MTLHNESEHNSPEVVAALKAHGMDADKPSHLADAFRLGWAARDPAWAADRCAECNCENGGAECDWIKTPKLVGGDDLDVTLLPMKLSGDRTEYWVQITSGGRTFDVGRYDEKFLNRARYTHDSLRHVILGEPEPEIMDDKYADHDEVKDA